jgi:hypothetical protein
MNRHEARKKAMNVPFAKKQGFVLIKPADDSLSWQLKGEPLPQGARIVEEWMWHPGWSPKIVEFDEVDWLYSAQFLDIEALFAIDWTELCFPGLAWNIYGLESIPYHLCDLISPDPTIRSNASEMLLDLEQDGIISDLTTKVVPFLLQLVCHPALPDRNDILDALESIVEASRYQMESGPHLSSYARIDPPEPDERVMLQNIHQQIAEACLTFIELLTHSEVVTRKLASHILGHFPERVAEIWPALEQAFLREQDEILQATFLKDLSSLAAGGLDASIAWFEKVRLTHPSELVRFVATVRLPHITKQMTSSTLVTSLISLLETEPEALRHQYMAFVGTDNPQYFYLDLISALQTCEPTLRKLALPILLQQFYVHTHLPRNKALVVNIAKALIDFVFPQMGEENPIVSFDVDQQQVISALCAYDKIWDQWRWDKHLIAHGLPDKREDLLAMGSWCLFPFAGYSQLPVGVYGEYENEGLCKPSLWQPAMLVLALILEAYTGASNDGVIEATV